MAYITDALDEAGIVSSDVADLGIPGLAVVLDAAEASSLGMFDEGWDGNELATQSLQGRGRVGRVRVTNCQDVDVAGATAEIMAVQARNTRSRTDKTYHLVFSFPAGEQPTSAQLADIEESLCAAIGLAEHQRISAVHHDTENLHVHVAINKVHPKTFRNIEPYYDMPNLQAACIAAEIRHGLTRTNHGIAAERRAAKSAVPDGAPSDQAAFLEWVRQHAGPCLEAAADWQDAAARLAELGLEIRPRGAGLVIAAPGSSVTVKASDLGKQYGHLALTRRWGEWRRTELLNDGTSAESVAADQALVVSGRAADMESHSGRQSATAWLRMVVPGIVAGSENWAGLHQQLADRGITLAPRNGGAVFIVDGRAAAVKGSQISQACRWAALVDRFGPPAPAQLNIEDRQVAGSSGELRRDSGEKRPASVVRPGQNAENRPSVARDTSASEGGQDSPYDAPPLHRHKDAKALFEAYQADRQTALEKRRQARETLRSQHATYREELRVWYARRREGIHRRGGLTRSGKDAELAALERDRRQDMDRAYESMSGQRKEITVGNPLLTWSAFLQQRAAGGDAIALAVLRSRSRSAKQFAAEFLMAASPAEARHVVLPKLGPSISKSGTVTYRTRDGGAVLDQAKTVDIQEGSLGASALAVVLAAEKFKGTQLRVAGGEDFRRQVAQAAAVCNLGVTFEDPSLEAIRRQYEAARDIVAAGGSLVSSRVEDFGLPGVQVELTADVADRLGIVGETALSPEDAWSARTPTRHEAVRGYVDERNSKRTTMYDIPYHREWETTDAGDAVFRGRRRLGGGAEAVLLQVGQEVLVKAVSSAQMAKAGGFAVGQVVRLDGQGRFVSAVRSRK